MSEGTHTNPEADEQARSLEELARYVEQLLGAPEGEGTGLERLRRGLLTLGRELDEITGISAEARRGHTVLDGLRAMRRELKSALVSQHFSHNIIEVLNDGILAVDLDERIIRTNHSFRTLSGYGDGDILGRPANIFFHMRSDEDFDIREISFGSGDHMPSFFLQRLAQRGGRHELFLFTQDGGAKPVAVTAARQVSRSGAPMGYVCSVQDISEQVRQERNLHRLALQDGLTGLPNRRAMEDVLGREWKASGRSKQPMSVLMVDVDRFKPYNDHFGHLDGDDLLRKIAKVVGSSVRRPRDLAARYGGEEFIVVLPETDREGAERVAENIRTSVIRLKARAAPGGLRLVTVSIGVATTVPSDTLRATDLVDAADTCLYQAKEAGRNRSFATTLVVGNT